jgi:hypothetical protein
MFKIVQEQNTVFLLPVLWKKGGNLFKTNGSSTWLAVKTKIVC